MSSHPRDERVRLADGLAVVRRDREELREGFLVVGEVVLPAMCCIDQPRRTGGCRVGVVEMTGRRQQHSCPAPPGWRPIAEGSDSSLQSPVVPRPRGSSCL